MIKRGMVACLLAVMGFAAVSCDDSRTAKIEDVTCGLDCSKNVDGRAQVCVFLSGVESCKSKCFGDAEGSNEAVCYINDSTEVPVHKSAVDTCAKDELGTLYSIDTTYETCVISCNDGVCENEPPGPLTCEQTGNREVAAFTINGSEVCKNKCLGTQEGENKVCVQDSAGGTEKSVVDTCAKDDKGALYSTNSDSTDCPNGCDETSHECKSQVGPNQCNAVGGRPQAEFVIDGTAQCKQKCLGTVEGENHVCWRNDSLGPNAKYRAFVDTCAKDENDALYSQSATEGEECADGCTNGVCGPLPPKPVCDPDCAGYTGTRDMTCVDIDNVPTCKPRCLGGAVGENFPVCYANLSIQNPKKNSIVDVCAKDPSGTLYSTDERSTECPGECDESTGLCVTE